MDGTNLYIVSVDRLDRYQVVISFSDDIAALYSVSLLRQMLPQAKILEDEISQSLVDGYPTPPSNSA